MPGGPGHGEFAAQIEAEAHFLDAPAFAWQFAQHIGPQGKGAFHDFAGFLQRLPCSNLAQYLQQGSLGRRDERCVSALLAGTYVKQGLGLICEYPSVAVLRRKPASKPIRKAVPWPSVELEDGLRRHLMTDDMPIEFRFAADTESLETPLEQRWTGVHRQWVAGMAINTAREPKELSRPDKIDRKIRRDSDSSEALC